eukprot:scaffold167993_cov30-Tisochrysis_lutea.AAC.2
MRMTPNKSLKLAPVLLIILLIPLSFIAKEAQHVEGFAPELALVTKGGRVCLRVTAAVCGVDTNAFQYQETCAE